MISTRSRTISPSVNAKKCIVPSSLKIGMQRSTSLDVRSFEMRKEDPLMPTSKSLSYAERWSPEAVEECCELWNLTAEEQAALLALKEEIQTVDHWKNDPFEATRFLKEFKFDWKTTENKFRASVQWRLDHNADHILEEYTPPALYNYFPLGVLEGADRDGDPIYIERSGAADTLGLLHRFGKEEMIQQAIWGKELMSRGPWQESWPHGTRRVKYFTSILDLKGLNRHHLNPSLVPVGQAVTRLVQDNYPGMGKKILVIRAPYFFRVVWNIFKHFVDPHVKELLEIATEKETPELLEKYMDLSVLPKEIVPEGRGRTVDGYETIWEGGPLPPPRKDDATRRTPIYPSSAAAPPETPTTTTTSTSDTTFSFDKSPTPPKTPTKTPVPRTPLQPTTSDGPQDTAKSWETIPAMTPTKTPIVLLQTTPLQPTRSRSESSTQDTTTGGEWESLPQDTTRRNIQQAWTVTPNPTSHDLEQVWSDSNLEAAAQLWQLSPDEKTALRQLRDNMKDIHHWKNDPYEVIRFYKALGNTHPNIVHKTEHQFRKMIIWRVENDRDNFLKDYGQPDPLFHYMPIAVLKGLDKDGDPIYIDRMGACDYSPLLRHFGPDAMVDYITFVRELNSTPPFWQPYQQQVGHKVKSYTVIIDLQGLNAGHLRPALWALLKRTAKLSQENYSGWAKRILVIRAPPIFKLVWKLVTKLFAPHVRALMKFSQGDYRILLDQYIDRKVLPSVICPEEGEGAVMPGYYENVRLEGGPIPAEAFQKAGTSQTPVPVFSPRSMPTDEAPSTPVNTTHLLLGHWKDAEESPVRAHATTEQPWQSPMFKYNW